MSHELKSCYVTGQYEGSHCVFVVQVEATENLGAVNAYNFEDFLNSHSYKVVKVQTERAANFVAMELKSGKLIVDKKSINNDSVYVQAIDPKDYPEYEFGVDNKISVGFPLPKGEQVVIPKNMSEDLVSAFMRAESKSSLVQLKSRENVDPAKLGIEIVKFDPTALSEVADIDFDAPTVPIAIRELGQPLAPSLEQMQKLIEGGIPWNADDVISEGHTFWSKKTPIAHSMARDSLSSILTQKIIEDMKAKAERSGVDIQAKVYNVLNPLERGVTLSPEEQREIIERCAKELGIDEEVLQAEMDVKATSDFSVEFIEQDDSHLRFLREHMERWKGLVQSSISVPPQIIKSIDESTRSRTIHVALEHSGEEMRKRVKDIVGRVKSVSTEANKQTEVNVQDLSSPHKVKTVPSNPMKGINFKGSK